MSWVLISDATCVKYGGTGANNLALHGYRLTLSVNYVGPLELHLTTSELWFGQEQEGLLP